MRVTTELGLVFPPGEANYLGSIFRGYVPNHPALPEDEKQEISDLWAKVSEAIMFKLFNPGGEDEFPADYPEIRTPNIDNAIGKAIGWAALHMVPGSAFITGWVGEILESDYLGVVSEDPTYELGDEMPRSNDSMANTIAGSFLRAGVKAQEWAVQLLEANP